jgi:protein-S-isoprenylcysteine O-methyltransferase Ste14
LACEINLTKDGAQNMNTTTYRPGKREERAWIAFTLDWGERVLLVALYGMLAHRIVVDYLMEGSIPNLIFIFSEGIAVFLILIRRTTDDVSRHPGDWVLAFGGTTLAMLVYPNMERALLPPVVAGSIMFIGMLVQISGKLILGRSWGCVPANRGIKYAGPYRFVRHPVYAGYLLTHIAFLLMNPTAWNLVIYVSCYTFQISRLLAEERLLCKDPNYAEYMTSVRYRLIPGVF